ncbi:MAG: carboxymuconolactone decarboxylase family protein [Deltaproteobacteria bacterium]|nr:carboxymuconolactone decarboxylase family protein [Deltaproteobacteria bacterium]
MGGAIPGKDFLEMTKEAGFRDVEIVSETGFNSSPVTKGMLFRAVKPAVSISERGINSMAVLDKYKEFFDDAYASGALDRKTKHLIALGASLAAGCDP